MGFKDKLIDATKAVGDKAQNVIEEKRDERSMVAANKEEDKAIQAKYLDDFKPTKVMGDLEIDMDHRLFKVRHASAGLKKKDGLMKTSGKAVAALCTYGASVVIEKTMLQPSDRVFTFDELYDYELMEDDSQVTKGGLGMAVAGGVLFGGAGAIAGGLTGKKKAKKEVESLVLKINLNDIEFPCVMIPYITKSTKTKSNAYIDAFNTAQETISCLDIVLRMEEAAKANAASSPAPAADPAEQIMKLKELLDMGALTQEEFDLKKKEILGL